MNASPFAREWTDTERAAFVPLITGKIETLEVIEGHSLADFIAHAVADGKIGKAVADAPTLVIVVGGVEVSREHWRWVRPKAGAVIMVTVRAAGGKGGKNILRAVLMLSVVVLAAWAGPAGAAALGFLEGTTAFAVASGVISTVVTLAGNALINAIAPIPQQSLPARSQSYSFTGSQNTLKPFAPCTFVLGKHRMVPPYCLQWHTSMYGDSVIFYGLFQIHVGPCNVYDLKIGETPFENILYAGRQDRLLGEAYDTSIYDLIPNVVKEVQEQLDLKEDNGWETRSFPRNATELSFDIAFPGGLNDGEGGDYTVLLECQYRKVGETTWIDLPTAANPSYMTGAGAIRFNEEYYHALRRTFQWTPTGGPGDFEMRIRRTTTDDLTLPDDSWLVCMRAHRPDPPVTNDDLSVIALFLTATDQINGVIDQFNLVVEPIVNVWNGGTWLTEAASRNPAAQIRWLLTGPAIAPAYRLTADDFDETLVEFFNYCADSDLTCDHVVDYGPSVEVLAQTIASCGNAHFGRERGKIRIVIDKPKEATQLFTASTVSGFRGNIVYGPEVHALKTTFLNEDKGWEPEEMIAYADGYDAETAIYIEGAEIPGKTRASDVWRSLRRILKRGLIRIEDCEFTVDIEHLAARFGERAYVEHFAMQTGTQSGHIKAVALSGSDATGATLDEVLTFEAGKNYGIRFRRVSDGALVLAPVDNPATGADVLSDEVEFTTPLTGANLPTAGDLYAFGEIGKIGMDCSIIGIVPGRDDTAVVSVVPYDETLFADDVGLYDYILTEDGWPILDDDGNPFLLEEAA